MTAITIPRQPYSEWLARLRSVALGLGGRGVLGLGLGQSNVSAAVTPWYLSGGVAAANCLAAYTPKGAASLALSYDNNAAPGNGLADGTYDAAPGVAPTWDAVNGWTFDGLTQWLDSGYAVPSGSMSVLVQFSAIANTGFLVGAGTFYINPDLFADPGKFVYYVHGSGVARSPRLLTGNLAIALYGYRNGIAETSALTQVVNSAPRMFLGARSLSGEANGFINGNIAAVAIYNTTLTAPEVLAISNAMSLL